MWEAITEIGLWVVKQMPDCIAAFMVLVIILLFLRQIHKTIGRNLFTQQQLNQLFADYLGYLICKKKANVQQFISRTFSIMGNCITQTVKEEEKAKNPLTINELQRLKTYLSKAERHQSFTIQEAEDFNKIAKKLSVGQKIETPNTNWGKLFISFLAGIILGNVLFDEE